MKQRTKKTIRHPKKEPLNIKDSEKITFSDFLEYISIGSELDNFQRILKKLYLNSISEKPIKHIRKILDEDYPDLQWIVYYLASLGFRFIDIHYLLLKTVSDRRLSKWANELLEDIFLQAPVQIYLYREKELTRLTDEYKKKSKLQRPDKKKQEKRFEHIVATIFSQKIVIISLKTGKVLSMKELLILKKVDRKK